MLVVFLSSLSLVAPTHLIVLQHGLYGAASHLCVLAEKLNGGDGVLVHSARSNEGRNRDGIAAGGSRLAEEIQALIASHPSLSRLSLIGNSLGGLYVRFAAAELLDNDGTLAGLEADTLITTCSPHLGVRRHLYLPLPSQLFAAGRAVAGLTAEELLLCDDPDKPLLLRMSSPSSHYGKALKAFRRRRLYANIKGDFLVPFGTAAIEGGRWGAGVYDARHADDFLQPADGLVFVEPRVWAGEVDGIAAVREAGVSDAGGGGGPVQEAMVAGLNTCSWSKVAVSFRGASTALPVAHNRLPALRRDGWRKAFSVLEKTHLGVPIMSDVARYVLQVDLE